MFVRWPCASRRFGRAGAIFPALRPAAHRHVWQRRERRRRRLLGGNTRLQSIAQTRRRGDGVRGRQCAGRRLQRRPFSLHRSAELGGAQRVCESRTLAGSERLEEIARGERAKLLERWRCQVHVARAGASALSVSRTVDMPSRILVLTVPSGGCSRSATSWCVNPSKNASSMATRRGAGWLTGRVSCRRRSRALRAI